VIDETDFDTCARGNILKSGDDNTSTGCPIVSEISNSLNTFLRTLTDCWDSVIHGLSHYRTKDVLDRRNKMCSSSLTHREMRSERTFWIQEPLPIHHTSF
jgi:hypothetical protein